MFKYTLDNKRYHTLNYYLKNKFGCKVAKIPLNPGFNCPNKISGGCIYCSNNAKANIINDNYDVVKQFKEELKIYENKWKDLKYIAYLQTGTNTNTSVDNLKNICEPLLNIKNVLGIAIATRPDCINKEMLSYLNELNRKTYLTIELGLQSSKNETLKYINRGHTKEDFTKCVKNLHDHNIFVVAHIINGLPNETKIDMLNTCKYLNEINIDAIKIHMLHIDKNTPLEKMYKEHPFPILSMDEYTDIVCEQLQILKDTIVVERITADPVQSELIEPKWLLKKFVILNTIDKKMKEKNIYQGEHYERSKTSN